MKLSEHFDSSEFECHHCGTLPEKGVSPEFIEKLEALRAELGGRPVIITSGYRCEEHNRAVGGAPRSYHTYSDPLICADIKVPGRSVDEIAAAARKVGFTGIGLYRYHVHVDLRATPWEQDFRGEGKI